MIYADIAMEAAANYSQSLPGCSSTTANIKVACIKTKPVGLDGLVGELLTEKISLATAFLLKNLKAFSTAARVGGGGGDSSLIFNVFFY